MSMSTRLHWRGPFLFVICVAVPALACRGEIIGSTAGNGSNPGEGGAGGNIGPGNNMTPVEPPPAGTDSVFFGSAVRRLTKSELRASLQDLLGLDLGSELAKFPEDYGEAGEIFAFDNNYAHQQPSSSLVEAARNLADIAGAKVLTEEPVKRRLVTCAPTGAGDAACLKTFVTAFGRRAFRRPLTAAEVDNYVAKVRPLAVEQNDFWKSVSLVVRAMLQDVEFLYRPEIGQPVIGNDKLFKLTGTEMASRLSFFLWGTGPDDALLDAALGGARLGTPAAIRQQAERMLADPRAQRGIARFHGMWLGYERQPPAAPLGQAMAAETAALIDRVIFKEKRPWLDLFRMKETYVDAALAAHYGLPAPAGGAAGWVSYGDSGRQGILSHGAFLGVERKHEDTSPTMRGQFIRTRLLCQVVPPPPPELNVDVDTAPTEGACKSDRYNMWQKDGCKACHLMMDPIGHGLENFDRLGRFRTTAPSDAGKPGCEMQGQGQLLAGAGTAMPFSGVAGLSDRLVESGAIEACLVTQLGSFLLGRYPRADEITLFERVAARFAAQGHRFDSLLLDVVSLPGFGYRVTE
jgi:hypothetical protein